MTAEILNHLQAEPQSDFLLRDILPGAAWAPYVGRDIAVAWTSNRGLEAGAEEGSGLKGSLFDFSFEV